VPGAGLHHECDVDDKFYIEDSGGGFSFFPYVAATSFKQWSQELRLSSELERFRWQAGGYYLDMQADTFQSVQGAAILGGTSNTQILSTVGLVDSLRTEFPTAPSVSLNFLGRYEWPAFAGLVGMQIDGGWNDKQFLEGTNSQVSFEPAYSVWNASLSYRTTTITCASPPT
jgi:hypothetical protein